MRSWLPVLAVAVMAVIGDSAQQPTFHVAVDLVTVDVSVTRNRRPVSGLTLENFALYDNGVRQRLHAVWSETVPLEAFLVLDTSESVAGDRLSQLVAAARGFTAGLRDGDQAALITFSHRILVPQPLTPDLAALSRALSAITAGGATALYDATSLAPHARAPGPSRGVAVVFTDGYDTASWLSERQVIEASERSDLVVYGVSATERWVAKQNPFPPQDRFLEAVAARTGGRLFRTSWGPPLGETFAQVLEEIRARYLLTYYPDNRSPGWHRLDVRLVGARGELTARPGYHVDPR